MTTPNVTTTRADAKANVLSRLDAALYWWIEEERFLSEAGRTDEAAEAHKNVLRVDRARKAEERPPVNEHPHTLAIPGCARCDAREAR